MGGLFSSSSSSSSAAAPVAKSKPVPQMSQTDKAVLELKVSRDKLKRYKQKLEKEREQTTQKAKSLVKQGKKAEALTLLKVKKYKDKQCLQLEQQLDNVNHTLGEIISADMTVQMMKALEQGTSALQRLNSEMPMEKIEQLMDDTAEAIAYQQEVSSLLAGSLTGEDVDLVETELEDMVKEINRDKVTLPKAPTGELRPSPELPKPQVEAEKDVEERTLVLS
ncbi:hypothetical protein BASA82_000015 [Batrachochytrium salamandrivorans]|nr:hypothetical protein BASA81_000213 [Batrachochytrium salamandrivorans]KAH9262961.1 hypothetical protein BASA82_000015 [Batrachochytrium salamandrivorans]